MTQTQDYIEQFLESLSENGYSRNSVRAYRADLQGYATWIDQNSTSEPANPKSICEAMPRYLTSIRDFVAAATVRRKKASLGKFSKFLGVPEALEQYRAPTVARGDAHPIPEGIPGVLLMLKVAENHRYKALIALQGLCGLRVGEAIQVTKPDFNTNAMGTYVRVRGKGDKERRVPVPQAVFDRYIKPLFRQPYIEMGTRKGFNLPLLGLGDRRARQVISQIGRQALGHHVASHDLRMTAGSAFFKRTKNIRATQEFLGHEKSETTETYTAVTEDELRAGVEYQELQQWAA